MGPLMTEPARPTKGVVVPILQFEHAIEDFLGVQATVASKGTTCPPD